METEGFIFGFGVVVYALFILAAVDFYKRKKRKWGENEHF